MHKDMCYRHALRGVDMYWKRLCNDTRMDMCMHMHMHMSTHMPVHMYMHVPIHMQPQHPAGHERRPAFFTPQRAMCKCCFVQPEIKSYHQNRDPNPISTEMFNLDSGHHSQLVVLLRIKQGDASSLCSLGPRVPPTSARFFCAEVASYVHVVAERGSTESQAGLCCAGRPHEGPL